MPPAEEPSAEPRQPRRWRGLPNFLREILIVVLGVLIALGAQQVVETIHEERVSNEARESVRAELNLNVTNFKRREAVQACIDQKLSAIGQRLDAAERGAPFEAIGYVGTPPSPALAMHRWEPATAGGRTSLLPIDEQRDLARVYIELTRTDRRQFDEENIWGQLAALEGASRPTAEMLDRAREALGRARHEDFLIRSTIRQAETYAGRIGIKGDAELAATNRGVMQSVCVPIDTLREKAAALTQHPSGAP
jgi:hypothetical protein